MNCCHYEFLPEKATQTLQIWPTFSSNQSNPETSTSTHQEPPLRRLPTSHAKNAPPVSDDSFIMADDRSDDDVILEFSSETQQTVFTKK